VSVVNTKNSEADMKQNPTSLSLFALPSFPLPLSLFLSFAPWNYINAKVPPCLFPQNSLGLMSLVMNYLTRPRAV